jgi:hypothetical protein
VLPDVISSASKNDNPLKKPALPCAKLALSKNKLQPPDFERVALAFETWGFSSQMGSSPENPGLKSETWATHSIISRAEIRTTLFGLTRHQSVATRAVQASHAGSRFLTGQVQETL